MTLEEAYRNEALELLKMYINAEETVIGEYSGDFYESRLNLEKHVKESLKKLNAEDMYDEFTKDHWIFEVGDYDDD